MQRDAAGAADRMLGRCARFLLVVSILVEKGGKPSAESGVEKSCGKTRRGGMVIPEGTPEWLTREMDAGGSMVLAGSKKRTDDLRRGNGVASVTRRLVVSFAEKGI